MTEKYSLNLNWLFKPSYDPADIHTDHLAGYSKASLPHTVKELSYNCFSQSEIAIKASYIRKLTIPEQFQSNRAILEFLGVMARYELSVNGQFVYEHKGGYSRSRVDITKYLHSGENTLFMMVDSTENMEIPPFGKTIDYLCFGGIYRDVNLLLKEDAYIEDVLYRYDLENDRADMYPEVILNSVHDGPGMIHVSLKDADGNVCKEFSKQVSIEKGVSHIKMDKVRADHLHLWAMDDPYLYKVEVTLSDSSDGRNIDTAEVKVGFRKTECKPDGFYLNGEKIKLVGLDRHQSFPYIGYAAPERVQKKDADILKNYLHINTVRTSHYLQSAGFLDKCDEVGLMVFSEIPGWGYIGNEKFKEVSHQDIRDMIITQFNHPSIFIWSIRINESADDDEFYSESNRIAHELDPSRPTTGVRCIRNSHLLEDVYSFNDFIHQTREVKHYREIVLENQQSVTGLDHKVPYIVTEYCGHVYPTKPFDGEERMLRHAQIHARVQNANFERKDALGAIGWCAFDYQTHGDFGAGDKICYHGVMDMFRMPKYAAYVYRSQVSPEKEIVLEPLTLFARGENDDNKPIPFMVCTNADYIEVECYGKSIGKFFPSLVYCSLPHPPIMVDKDPGHWADLWLGGSITAYYKGKAVAKKVYSKDAHLDDLIVKADDHELFNTVMDSTRITARFVDQCKNSLPYYNGVIQVETSDNIRVIGPSTLAVVGGRIGFWVKTIENNKVDTAEVRVKALNTDIPEKVLAIALKPDETVKVLN